jgi:predicted Zn-dependent protease
VLANVAAPPAVLLAIAHALETNGNPKSAVQLLEAQLKLQPPTTQLYTALADACQASGNIGRANEARALAAKLKD